MGARYLPRTVCEWFSSLKVRMICFWTTIHYLIYVMILKFMNLQSITHSFRFFLFIFDIYGYGFRKVNFKCAILFVSIFRFFLSLYTNNVNCLFRLRSQYACVSHVSNFSAFIRLYFPSFYLLRLAIFNGSYFGNFQCFWIEFVSMLWYLDYALKSFCTVECWMIGR